MVCTDLKTTLFRISLLLIIVSRIQAKLAADISLCHCWYLLCSVETKLHRGSEPDDSLLLIPREFLPRVHSPLYDHNHQAMR